MAEAGCFSFVPEDVVFNIFFKLQDDPRNWARLACVCTKFSSIVRNVCCKSLCYSSIPAVVSELLPSPSAASSSSSLSPPGGWASLYKLAVCCPGLHHAGILLENSDFGLERELGPDQSLTDPGQVSKPVGSGLETPSFRSASKLNGSGLETPSFQPASKQNGSGLETPSLQPASKQTGSGLETPLFQPASKQIKSGLETSSFHGSKQIGSGLEPTSPFQSVSKQVESGLETQSFWSLYDDLYTDTLSAPPEDSLNEPQQPTETTEIRPGRGDLPAKKRRKISRSLGSHLAHGGWSLSREQGTKLLASRFRGDCLYICNWPGCTHVEEKRTYMLFRGVFKDFKRSRVWRTINEDGGGRSKVTGLKCAFCECDETWDMHSSFCLRRVFGFHDDGEPVVRAYVCENGHVSGAWTNLPLYT
ncbi:PREDICTED: phytochrome A-associated F-box protein [Brassica oleracea var. oleracea]|uniref:F-box domain-containing protein n=1 Tax=Brassica oleracea var. oleracea TaxID=109376 RepID=A0A0D3E023_BRAOL|nr:PREDICTED: phytochrome A-associated F-box protein [Brassica oleracea var. oleracea]